MKAAAETQTRTTTAAETKEIKRLHTQLDRYKHRLREANREIERLDKMLGEVTRDRNSLVERINIFNDKIRAWCI